MTEKARGVGKGRILLRALGVLLTAIGAAGVFLPLLPGVPFLILAAACFARSSPRLEAWLLDHPLLGPGVRKWRERGAISRKSKLIALSMMTLSGVAVAQSPAPLWAQALSLGLMAVGALFVATRPND
ncbi:MAG: hypothetical protein A3E78_00960 [Alphaproteobacteria bacterium RIFCSPHIGHO2_12_FULL_63_12]|nr:MAG: hypothetical protein A3E78_00960 [Alphaproteobacteria bacterium RIFCSPHIGHO2_12_FULL_63_12]